MQATQTRHHAAIGARHERQDAAKGQATLKPLDKVARGQVFGDASMCGRETIFAWGGLKQTGFQGLRKRQRSRVVNVAYN